MFQRLREKRQDEGGFTLIELLVVILIIAILAAIAIPVFLRQREKGWVAQSQSALKNGATAVESYAVPKGGDYTLVTDALMEAEGWKKAPAVAFGAFATKTATAYCFTVTHTSLPAGHDWKTAHYASWTGEPVAGACTAPPA
jgi:type IV pilus assembly protein PilA